MWIVATEKDYLAAQEELNQIMKLDPAPDSANGRRLIDLARAIEMYEEMQTPCDEESDIVLMVPYSPTPPPSGKTN